MQNDCEFFQFKIFHYLTCLLYCCHLAGYFLPDRKERLKYKSSCLEALWLFRNTKLNFNFLQKIRKLRQSKRRRSLCWNSFRITLTSVRILFSGTKMISPCIRATLKNSGKRTIKCVFQTILISQEKVGIHHQRKSASEGKPSKPPDQI